MVFYFWKIKVKLAIYREIKGHIIITNFFFVGKNTILKYYK